jgi:hypothetical protein
MRKFHCENCGQRLSVPRVPAGKRGRCPRCKQPVTIPEPWGEDIAVETPGGTVGPDASPRDRLLLTDAPAEATADEVEAAYQRLREMQGRYRLKDTDEEPPERKLPWFIDVFLYPLSKGGLTILLLSAGVPFLLRLVLRFFMFFSGKFGPMLVFWVLFLVVHYAALLLFSLYMAWYVCECIRDSGAGSIRAADTTATTPGVGELLGQALTVIATAALCMAPALVYLNETRSLDGRFWTLYAVGGFVFPMALLAVVMFESLRALNPLFVLGSILRTFLPYSVLVPFCYGLCLLLPVAARTLRTSFWMLSYLLLFLAFYQLLVLAHLLGRFYWRNRERLDWDV